MKRSVLVAVLAGAAVLATGCGSNRESVRGGVTGAPSGQARPEPNANKASHQQSQSVSPGRADPGGRQ